MTAAVAEHGPSGPPLASEFRDQGGDEARATARIAASEAVGRYMERVIISILQRRCTIGACALKPMGARNCDVKMPIGWRDDE